MAHFITLPALALFMIIDSYVINTSQKGSEIHDIACAVPFFLLIVSVAFAITEYQFKQRMTEQLPEATRDNNMGKKQSPAAFSKKQSAKEQPPFAPVLRKQQAA